MVELGLIRWGVESEVDNEDQPGSNYFRYASVCKDSMGVILMRFMGFLGHPELPALEQRGGIKRDDLCFAMERFHGHIIRQNHIQRKMLFAERLPTTSNYPESVRSSPMPRPGDCDSVDKYVPFETSSIARSSGPRVAVVVQVGRMKLVLG